jgi:hypothetical protein
MVGEIPNAGSSDTDTDADIRIESAYLFAKFRSNIIA